MAVNIDADAELIPIQARQGGGLFNPVFATPTGSFVSSINGQTGSIVDSGGSSGFTYSAGAGVITLISPLTTKGDLYGHNGTNGLRVAVAADGQILTADAASAAGWKWAAPAAIPALAVATKTTNYNLADTDDVILVDTTAGIVTITLHAVATAKRKVYNIKKINAGANNMVIDPAGGEVVDDAANITTAVQYASYTIFPDGSKWWIL